MFFFPRDRFTTSDGIVYLVEFARIERPFSWWEAQEAAQIIRRDVMTCKIIVGAEAALTVFAIAAAFFRVMVELR